MTATESNVEEYLAEIRDKVCSRCVERPPGGPPCEPLGKFCGVEQHLPELIESIHQVHSNMLEPYLDHNRMSICANCSLLHSSVCPCPMDYLSALVVEAVETVDQRHAVRDRAFQSGPLVSMADMADVEEIRRAYKVGKGTWSGCDWPTRFGKTALCLEGWHASEARVMAEKMKGTEAGNDWHAAARWLAQVEQHAEWAETQAAAALTAAEAGRWPEAFQLAEQAWALEFGTGRPIWRGLPFAWEGLLKAARAALMAANEPRS